MAAALDRAPRLTASDKSLLLHGRRPPAFLLTEAGGTPIILLMAALAFDTLKAAKALRAAGFDDAQAEAVISTVGDAVGGNVATKADLQDLELRITHRFESLYKHLWAMSVGIVTAVGALMKLLS